MNNILFLLFSLAVVLWFWFQSLRVREIAKTICEQTCIQNEVQLLDDTIALMKMRIKRNKQGNWGIQRTYRFEFYTGDGERYQGTLLMHNTTLEMVELPIQEVINYEL